MIIAELETSEMPEGCDDCPLFHSQFSDYGHCSVTGYTYDAEESAERPGTDCPLREIPDAQ